MRNSLYKFPASKDTRYSGETDRYYHRFRLGAYWICSIKRTPIRRIWEYRLVPAGFFNAFANSALLNTLMRFIMRTGWRGALVDMKHAEQVMRAMSNLGVTLSIHRSR